MRGRKLALDQRLMNEMLEDNQNGKVGTCANNIYKIWEENKEQKTNTISILRFIYTKSNLRKNMMIMETMYLQMFIMI